MTNQTILIKRFATKKDVWKAWLFSKSQNGWVRGGFAWKTQQGAINFAKKMYPNAEIQIEE
jgi:hypothetical protein